MSDYDFRIYIYGPKERQINNNLMLDAITMVPSDWDDGKRIQEIAKDGILGELEYQDEEKHQG